MVSTFGLMSACLGQNRVDSVANTGQIQAPIVGSGETDSLFAADTIALDGILPSDSMPIGQNTDSFYDITQEQPFQISEDSIEAPIDYSATDSIIYDLVEEKVHLWGEAKVTYQGLTLTAHYIILDWANNQIVAMTDSVDGEPVGYAHFNDGGDEYEAKKIIYNYQTKKGKVYKARTQDGEGYILADQIKRNEHEEWYGLNGKYTTCSLEEPHFYIKAKKLKLIPDKVIVTGPANLVVHEVPTPLVAPFGIFPVQKGRTNGVILPQPGESADRGFYLENGGFYFLYKDYLDVQIRTLLSTSGTWNVNTITRYKVRYKYSGNLTAYYGQVYSGTRDDPDFSVQNNFRVGWTHTQDPKARPNSRFTANVNFGTSQFNKSFTNTQQSVVQSALVSKINYSRTWRGKPYTLNITLDHDQNLNTGLVNLTLPSISFGVGKIQPFKAKVSSSKRKWYENISIGYTINMRNQLSAYDSTFMTQQTLEDMKYGISQVIPISSSYKLFKYFTLTPAINYTERWYFKTESRIWDPTTQVEFEENEFGELVPVDTTYGRVQRDTIQGMKAARDFNMSVGLTTNMYGYLRFKKGKLKAIRHKMTPTISFNYRPDFGTEFWGNYREVQIDTAGNTQRYSIFGPSASLYGQPPDGMLASIGININNNIEAKVFSKKDTVNNEKKIKLIENFTVSANYNFAADSLNMSNINISAQTTLFDKVRVTFSSSFDPYVHDSATNRQVNTFLWQDERKIAKLRSASLNLSTSLQSKRSTARPNTNASTDEEREMVLAAPNDYYDFTVPWSVSLGYTFGMTRGVAGNTDTLRISTNSLSVNLDMTLTQKWKVVLRSGYDFVRKGVVYTSVDVVRDLHCWELAFFWVPYPLDRQTYAMRLNVKAAVLQDLKLSRKNNTFNTAF